MIQALHHIGLSVGDLAQSSAFLHRAFAFDRTALTMPSPAPTLAPQHHIAQCQLLLTPNCYLELQTFAPAQPQPNRWRPVNEAGISHFCVQHQQMARLYDDCAAAGAQFHSAPVDLGTGWRYCYARDPEGNVIELEASPLAPLGQSPWAAHVAIVTPNIERLATFYHQLLGGARVGGRKIGPNPNLDLIAALPKVEVILTWLVGANLTLELAQYVSPAALSTRPQPFTAVGYNHLCFEVNDLPNTLAACVHVGAQQIASPDVQNGINTAYLYDPDGNVIELIELSPQSANLAIQQLPNHDIVARVAALRNR